MFCEGKRKLHFWKSITIVSVDPCVLYECKTGNSLFTISILARRRREKKWYIGYLVQEIRVNRNKFVTNLACIRLCRFSVHGDMTFNFPCP